MRRTRKKTRSTEERMRRTRETTKWRQLMERSEKRRRRKGVSMGQGNWAAIHKAMMAKTLQQQIESVACDER
jgi:hypothetical protein